MAIDIALLLAILSSVEMVMLESVDDGTAIRAFYAAVGIAVAAYA